MGFFSELNDAINPFDSDNPLNPGNLVGGGGGLGGGGGGGVQGNLDGLNQAARDNAQLSRDWLTWYQQTYQGEAPNRQAAIDIARRNADTQQMLATDQRGLTQAQIENMRTQQELGRTLSNAQIENMRWQQGAGDQLLGMARHQQGIADDYHRYNVETYRPLEQRIVRESQEFDTPQRREQAANAAGADVQTSVAAQKSARARQMASMGVNPNSGRFQALDRQDSIAAAAAQAGAMNSARERVEMQGHARRMDAASLGRNLPSAQATAAGQAMGGVNSASGAYGNAAGAGGLAAGAYNGAIAAGNAAGQSNSLASNLYGASLNSSLAPVTIGQQGMAGMGSAYGHAIAGNQSAGNLYGQAAQLQAGIQNSNMQGMGNLIGMGLGAWQSGLFSSSKDVKHAKQPTSASAALEGIKDLNVEQWKYDAGKGDGGEHVGPYAEDVQREFGDTVAPQGKAIDMKQLSAQNAKAIAALAKRVEQLTMELEAA